MEDRWLDGHHFAPSSRDGAAAVPAGGAQGRALILIADDEANAARQIVNLESPGWTRQRSSLQQPRTGDHSSATREGEFLGEEAGRAGE